MSRDPAQALPLLHALTAAVAVRAIYPPAHPRTAESVERLLEALEGCLRERQAEALTLLVIERELLVDERPLRAANAHLAAFVRTMNRLGVERLTLARGLGRDECHPLIEGLAGRGRIASTPHATCGRVELDEADSVAGGEAVSRRRTTGSVDLGEPDVERAAEVFLRFPADQEGSLEQLDQMLWHFVESFDQSSRSLLLLAPIRAADERLFSHSMNVALLTLAQARALGIGGQMLHDIGLAALLHDIGKLSLPPALLERNRWLDEPEWRQMMLHPELGAAQLCGLAAAPSLAVLVAYEHHLRWDGKPSFPLPSRPRLPNLASQLTAIADTYDAMVVGGALTDGVHGRSAMRVWQERAGSQLDPFLVGNFVLLIAETE